MKYFDYVIERIGSKLIMKTLESSHLVEVGKKGMKFEKTRTWRRCK